MFRVYIIQNITITFFQNWTNSMNDKDLKTAVKATKDSEKDIEVDENLPPVRSNNVILEGKKVCCFRFTAI